MYIGRYIQYPLFLSDFNETRIFMTHFWSVCQYQIPWTFVQREPNCSVRTDGQTWQS